MKIHTIIFGLHWLTKLDLLRLLLVSVLGWLATPECAVARSWTGDGETNVVKLWSNPANWTPQGVPQNGEDLWFGGTLSPDLLMVNDLPNLTVRSLRFAMEDIGDVAGHLYGNTLGISQGIFNTNYFECQVYIHCGVRLTGNATFVTGNPDYNSFFGEDVTMHISGPIDLNGHNLVLFADSDFRDTGRMYIQGGILGVGNVLAIAGGLGGGATDYYESSLEFSGTGNDFTGALTLDSRLNSEILLNLSSGVVVNDLLILTNVGDVKLLRANQIGDAATVRLKDGATLQLNGYSDTILNLELITDSNDSRPAVLDTFHFSWSVLSAGTLSVAGNITSICNNGAQTPAIKGILNLLSGSHDINVSGSVYAGLDIQAQMMGVGNFSKSGAQALLLTASNSFNSTISILKGVLDVRNNHALGDIVGSTEIFEGNLTLRNVAIGAESLFALGGSEGEFPGAALTSIGISSWSGQVLLNTNLVVTGDMSFTGSISGTGGMGCFGGGTIRLGGLLANNVAVQFLHNLMGRERFV